MLTRPLRFVHLVQLAQTLHGERHAKHEELAMTLLSVPIIDLAPYFAGTAEGKARLRRKSTRPAAASAFWSSPTTASRPG
jgi:hypothetical protein